MDQVEPLKECQKIQQPQENLREQKLLYQKKIIISESNCKLKFTHIFSNNIKDNLTQTNFTNYSLLIY